MLKQFIWKRYSTVSVGGETKATLITEFSFDEIGALNANPVGGESNVQKKRGVRGRIQQNAIEDNLDYAGDALNLSLAYMYMSKGQLLDFFEKATVKDSSASYIITAKNVYLEGDELKVIVEKSTNLFEKKRFTSNLNGDELTGEIKYGKFSSGISHGTSSTLKLPAKNAVISSENKDYSQRVE